MKYVAWLVALLVGLLGAPDLMAQNNGPGGGERESRTNGRRIKIKPRPELDTARCPILEYQTVNGTCNNIALTSQMDFGATDVTMDRLLTPEYGTSDSFNALGGENRISARGISNIVVRNDEEILRRFGLSALVFNWGQFIDHDITLMPELEDEAAFIELPADEPLFTVDLPFHRSEFFDERGDGLPREQLNLLTAWIDALMVYGSDTDRATWLRTMVDGKLKTPAVISFRLIRSMGNSRVPLIRLRPAWRATPEERPRCGLPRLRFRGSTEGYLSEDSCEATKSSMHCKQRQVCSSIRNERRLSLSFRDLASS